MLSSHEESFRSRFLGYVAGVVLALAASAGLAGCGGGGSASGGGEQVMIVPEPQPPPPEPPASAERASPVSSAQLPDPAEPVLAARRPGPDLVISHAHVGKTNPFASEYLYLSAIVRNAGSRTSAAARVHFWFSRDATLTSYDVPGGTESITGGIAPAKEHRVTTNSISPSDPGVYYFGACVDAVAGESNTRNNCLVLKRITVRRPPPPDIVFAWSSADPADPPAGGVFILRAEMRNTGGKTAGAVLMRYYRSDDAAFTASDPQVGSYWEGVMYTKSSLWPAIYLDAPDDPGTYYYRVCADAAAGGSDTATNCSAAVKVEVKRPRPNLRFRSTGRGSWVGSRFKVSVSVQNDGSPSPETRARFYHSRDRTITTDDTELTDIAVPALAKTESQTAPRFYSNWVLLPGPTTPGFHYYGACVDAVPDESDTTDNCTLIHRIIRR